MRPTDTFFHSAEWYDLSINWAARLGREVPVLRAVFGPPGAAGLLDAGCGTGHQAAELARLGYRVTGLDPDESMLAFARTQAEQAGAAVELVTGGYADIPDRTPGPFDGVYCLGNSLALSRDAAGAQQAVRNFAGALRPGGRLFVQILNFLPMRNESPCVRGPRVVVHDGVEYVSTRLFHFHGDAVDLVNVTLYQQDGWQQQAHRGRLYPIRVDEMEHWCAAAGLRIDERWGGYERAPFAAASSVDLIVVATKR